MADFQQNYLSSLAGGLQIGQQIKQQRDTSQINRLAGQAYGAAPQQQEQLLGQMNAINPQMAQEQEKGMAYSDERRNKTMVNMARMLTGAPEQARAGIYAQMVPTLSRFGMSELPQEYNAQTAPIIDQAAKSLIDASMGATGTPTDVRSFQMMTQGLSADDQMKARRINLGLDGRASSSGFSQVKFTGADGRERIGVLNGKTGQIDLPDGTSFNPQTGAISQTQGAQQDVPAPGLYNTPNGQARIGDRLTPEQWELAQADMANSGESDGYKLPSRDVSPQQFQRGGAFVGRSPEEQAALTEQAKTDVQLRNLPTELSMRTEADIAKSRGIEQAKSEQERASNERAKTAQLNNVDRGLSRIDTAIKALSGGMVNTGPLDGRLMVSTPQGQELEAAVGAIQNDMLALTRVPGIGSQSDLEAKIANLKYPSIYNHPSVNAANVQQLKAFMEDLRNQITGQAASQQGGGTSPSAGQRTVVRTGTSNGRKVIQYSDGSVEYGN